MIKTTDLKAKLSTAEYDDIFAGIYKKEDIASQKERYIRIAESFEQLFGTDREVGIFSAPGRTELGGNHTDHQNGEVLAASVNLDAIAIVEATEEYVVVKRQYEDGYHIIKVKTPCLLTAIAELATPRYMSVRGIVEAYEKEIKVLGFEDLKDELELDMIGLKGSPTNVFRSFTKEVKGAGTILEGLSADEAVKAIMDKLEAKFII